MHERAGPLIAAALIVSAISGTALAHSGATGIVRQRMDLMGEIADRMKDLGAMIRGRENFDPEVAGSAADALAGHAGEMLSLFPEGSAGGTSEARPAIWVDWQEFEGLAGALEEKASALSSVAQEAESVDEIRLLFADMGRTCSQCHEDFRLTK
ncbi:c-type cytochrome [Oricola indica]|jgi:cytochrome c556|uniref:c-type cytochrome n=1 Tax=Oricola indica TaxID=2872591 RepID=UPI001CC0C1F3|nr:cytochrome c [Oricola indica]